MKPSTPTKLALSLGLASSLVACVTSEPRRGRNEESGSCKEVTEPVVLRTPADLDKLPDGCWDLYAKLTVQGSEITSLAKLGDLKGADELEIIGTNLTTLDTPKKLNAFGRVTVTGNDKLRDLDDLVVEYADNVRMAITIDDNAVLTTIGDLGLVSQIDEDLTITSNPALRTVELRGLKHVGGGIAISDNAALTKLDLTKLATVELGLEVTDNAQLASVSSMAVSNIKGTVRVRGNRSLKTLGTMSSLTRIGGDFVVEDNDQLASMAVFSSSMQLVGGAVKVTGNALLADVGQVSRFQTIGSLTVTDNPALSFCLAREVVMCSSIAGSITVQNNKVGNNCTSWCGR